jgi:hypothetical protein
MNTAKHRHLLAALLTTLAVTLSILPTSLLANTAHSGMDDKVDMDVDIDVDADFDIVGEAFSLKNRTLIYREYHRIDQDHHTVTYADPEGQVFSTKNIDYSSNDEAPAFMQFNQWSGEQVSAELTDRGLTLRYSKPEKNISKQETLANSKTLIVDAGFNHYIQNNWQALLSGQSYDFDYALADRLDLIALTIKRHACAKSPVSTQTSELVGKDRNNHNHNHNNHNSDNKVCFRIGAKNRLIGWLMGPLLLEYQQENQQLLRFTGLANINDSKGKGLKVDIHYYYPYQNHPYQNHPYQNHPYHNHPATAPLQAKN